MKGEKLRELLREGREEREGREGRVWDLSQSDDREADGFLLPFRHCPLFESIHTQFNTKLNSSSKAFIFSVFFDISSLFGGTIEGEVVICPLASVSPPEERIVG